MKYMHIILLITSLLTTQAAIAGKESHGGDSYAQEFVSLGRVIAKSLLSKKLVLPNVEPERFNNQVEITQVVTLDKTIFEGAEVDAVNYPAENRIELNRKRWGQYETDIKRKMMLVLHEYLGVMRTGDYHYEISKDWFATFADMSRKTLAQLILETFDNECGDTWCEGDFDYRFREIKCSESDQACSLDITLIEKITNGPENTKIVLTGPTYSGTFTSKESGKYHEFEASCKIPRFSNLEEVARLIPKNDGYSVSVKDEFMSAAGDCFIRLERQATKMILNR